MQLQIRVLLNLTVLIIGSSSFATGLQKVICIDPGHPSENGVGTHGKHITEVKADWAVAIELKKDLQAAGFKVVMTKSTESQKVTNKARAEVANRAHAALMIRLHCDSAAESGIASYYPATQGRVGKKVGPSSEVIKESKRLAEKFHPAMIAALDGDLSDRGLKTDMATSIGHRQGGALTGSIYSQCPVILVEMAVLNNAHDDKFISSKPGQQTLAKALTAGIVAAVGRDD